MGSETNWALKLGLMNVNWYIQYLRLRWLVQNSETFLSHIVNCKTQLSLRTAFEIGRMPFVRSKVTANETATAQLSVVWSQSHDVA
jgi:hypothetical protein